MDSIHDIGGKHGLGPVIAEADEPAFHAPWEGRMHGIAVACQIYGINSTPEQRATIENMPHWLYLTTSYYEKWLYCYEKILEAKGVVKPGEIDRQIAAQSVPPIVDHPSMPDTPSDAAKTMHRVIYGGTPHDRPLARPPAFKPGDVVFAKNRHPTTHTRLPGYVKGKPGVIEVYHGAHCHHEALAEGRGDAPEHLYAVKFLAKDLWGPDAEQPDDAFYVDLFEDYLTPADAPHN
jgi:nitrile hydratase subunit beta